MRHLTVSFFAVLTLLSSVSCKVRPVEVASVKADNSDSTSGDAAGTAQEQRFQVVLSELAQIFQDARTQGLQPVAVAEQLNSGSRARYLVMQLEALATLYHDSFKKQLKPLDAAVSELSDQLSAYGDAVTQRKFAEAHGADAKVVNAFAKTEKKAQKSCAQFLDDNGWLKRIDNPDNPLEDMRRTVSDKIDWPKEKKDRAAIKDFLLDSLDEVQKKPFNLDNLEEGIHKFRRFERWIFITMTVTNGLVQGDTKFNPIPEYIQTLSDPSIPTKYSAFAENQAIERPIVVSQSLVGRAVQLIEDIGTAKDFGMLIEKMSDAMSAELGMNAAKAHQAARAMVLSEPKFRDFFKVQGDANSVPEAQTDMIERARAIYEEFNTKINPELIRELKTADERTLTPGGRLSEFNVLPAGARAAAAAADELEVAGNTQITTDLATDVQQTKQVLEDVRRELTAAGGGKIADEKARELRDISERLREIDAMLAKADEVTKREARRSLEVLRESLGRVRAR